MKTQNFSYSIINGISFIHVSLSDVGFHLCFGKLCCPGLFSSSKLSNCIGSNFFLL